MTFLLDQDVPDPIARVTQQAGHQAFRLREQIPADSPDDAVLSFAHSRQALLVTCDRDDFLNAGKRETSRRGCDFDSPQDASRGMRQPLASAANRR